MLILCLSLPLILSLPPPSLPPPLSPSLFLSLSLPPAQLLSHSEGVKCCVFSPDGNLLATCSDDTNVKVWEVGSTKCIATLTKNIER